MIQTATETRGVFERPVATFDLDPRVIGWILADDANPLNQIAHTISAGSTVLDIGAGNGILPKLLEALGKSVSIDAIEPDPVARELARPLYRQCFDQDLESFLENQNRISSRYDFIVMADVLEHLANPEPSLKTILRLLTPSGKLLLSTPNIAFASIRLALLSGRFDYTDSGILERTHLRFYTRATLLRLFQESGLHVAAELHCLRNPFSMEIVLDDLWFPPALLWQINRDPLSRVYQFVFYLTANAGSNIQITKIGNKSTRLSTYFLINKIRILKTRIRNHLRNITRAR
jgi:2-polyprenyl-3-methyl-5-hydroxy-6-metoxy-1,4-benzoquinol methylase